MANPDDGLSYCAQQVRRHDKDRFLTCLFAPPDRREALFGLYAFNLEVAKTREVVSEPLLGQIRLQWWREAIEELYAGSGRRHEVLQALAPAVARHRLDRAQFDRLIDAREADLDDAPPADLATLEQYAEATGASVTLLALAILDVDAPQAVAAARHVGTAWALSGLLRSVGFHARHHRCHLPRDLMDEHGVSPSAINDGKPQPGLARIAGRIAERAVWHLAAARRLRSEIPRAALPSLLCAPLARADLGRLAGVGHDPLAPGLHRPDPWRQLRVGAAALTGRY